MSASVYFQDEHHQFREQVRHFFQESVDEEAWEAAGRLPREIWRQMGELGFLGIGFPEAYGGAEADFFYSAIFLEELGRTGLGGFAAAVGVQQYMATAHLFEHGSEELKQRYLVPSISGEKVGALAISEPGAGSDVANLRTKARREGDEYVIDGAKIFITNGVDGDFVTVAARTGGDGASGISLIVVDRDTPGFNASRLRKMGWHCSDTGDLSFDQVRVPASNLIGEEGQGFYYIMEAFQLERLVAALTAIGGADRAIAETLAYIQQREAFGRPISRYQVLRHRLTDLMTELTAAKHLTYHACWLFDRGETDVAACTMAKLKTSELGSTVADVCLQCFGGYGFMEEYPIARLFRDARAGTIVGGTTEIMHEILGKMLIDGVSYQAPVKLAAAEKTSTEKPGFAEPSLPQLFAALPARFKGSDIAGVVQFDFDEDDSGQFTVTIGDGSCSVKPGLHGEASCVVTTRGEIYRQIELGQLAPEAAFMQGQIQISDLPTMMKFLQAFDSYRPEHNPTQDDSESTNEAAADSAQTSAPVKKKSPQPRPNRSGPLEHLRVLDLTRLYPGPLAGKLLADLGADVIKIEPPDKPDPMRSYPPFVDGESAGYLATNRNKSALALNWTEADGRAVLADLVKTADVVLEGFRPGVLEKLGAGYGWLSSQNKRIILVSITGFGQDGPYADQAGHDLNYIGYTGMLSPESRDEPTVPTCQTADVAGGAYAAVIAALTAVEERHRTGVGRHVDLAMLDATLPLMTLQLAHTWAQASGGNSGTDGLLSGALACYRTYRCKDDEWLALAALEPKFWRTFCETLSRTDWLDRHLATGEAGEQLAADIASILSQRPRVHWLQLFAGKDACLSPIHRLQDVDKDPHLRARHMISQQNEQPVIGNPWQSDRGDSNERDRQAPTLGQDSDEILAELGYRQNRITSLRDSGMIR